MAKRIFDLVAAFLGLLLLSPLLALIALSIKLFDSGPVFFRQERVGRYGRTFRIWKFRTMTPGAERKGPSVTQQNDTRITPLGRWLRRSKLDELPQFLNVLAGEMSIVGPRPEVPRYVRHYTPEQREVLNYRPGITDPASVLFRDEEQLLKEATDVEAFYLRFCLSRKVELNCRYARRANLLSDLGVVLQTLGAVFFRAGQPAMLPVEEKPAKP